MASRPSRPEYFPSQTHTHTCQGFSNTASASFVALLWMQWMWSESFSTCCTQVGLIRNLHWTDRDRVAHAGSPNDIDVRCPLVCELCGSQQDPNSLHKHSCSQPPSEPTSLMVDFVCQDCEFYNEIDSSLPLLWGQVCGWTTHGCLCQPSSCHDPPSCHDGIEGDHRIAMRRTNQELKCMGSKIHLMRFLLYNHPKLNSHTNSNACRTGFNFDCNMLCRTWFVAQALTLIASSLSLLFRTP